MKGKCFENVSPWGLAINRVRFFFQIHYKSFRARYLDRLKLEIYWQELLYFCRSFLALLSFPVLINRYFRKKNFSRFIVVTTLYNEENEKRRCEYIRCLQKNLQNKNVKQIVVFYDTLKSKEFESDDLYRQIAKLEGVDVELIQGRPPYSLIVDFVNKNFAGEHIIICNADIFFNHTLRFVNLVDLKKSIISLTRWEYNKFGLHKLFTPNLGRIPAKYFIEGRSQDAWIFKAPLHGLGNTKVEIGTHCCDSFLNYVLKTKVKRRVINPCYQVRAYHLHQSAVKSQDDVENKKRRMSDFLREQEKKGYVQDSVPFSFLRDDYVSLR